MKEDSTDKYPIVDVPFIISIIGVVIAFYSLFMDWRNPWPPTMILSLGTFMSLGGIVYSQENNFRFEKPLTAEQDDKQGDIKRPASESPKGSKNNRNNFQNIAGNRSGSGCSPRVVRGVTPPPANNKPKMVECDGCGEKFDASDYENISSRHPHYSFKIEKELRGF